MRGTWNLMIILFNCGYDAYLVSLWKLVWLVVIVEKGKIVSCVVLYAEYIHFHIYESVIAKGYCFYLLRFGWILVVYLVSAPCMLGCIL